MKAFILLVILAISSGYSGLERSLWSALTAGHRIKTSYGYRSYWNISTLPMTSLAITNLHATSLATTTLHATSLATQPLHATSLATTILHTTTLRKASSETSSFPTASLATQTVIMTSLATPKVSTTSSATPKLPATSLETTLLNASSALPQAPPSSHEITSLGIQTTLHTTLYATTTSATPSSHTLKPTQEFPTAQQQSTKTGLHKTTNSTLYSGFNKPFGVMTWIASGCALLVLVIVVIVTSICSVRRNRRKKSKLVKVEEIELERSKKRKWKKDHLSGIRDSKNVEDDTIYAPVFALDNAAVKFDETFLLRNPLMNFKSDHVYEEPINSHRSSVDKPLPMVPIRCEPDQSVPLQDDELYDTAREGVLTNTLKRINKEEHGHPVYSVLDNGKESLCADAEEPVYHVLESTESDNIYQSLDSPETGNEQTIYQSLTNKVRTTSAPISMLSNQLSLNDHVVNDVQCSRSYPEYSGDNLYQPLNNTERCPLDVSKTKNDAPPLPHRETEESLIDNEPTLHTIDVSANKKTTKKRGHRRTTSDTHTIVNISRLTRRASEGPIHQPRQQFPGRTRRYHSDAGLCPVDLNLLRVSIDFESLAGSSCGNSSESIYMSLNK